MKWLSLVIALILICSASLAFAADIDGRIWLAESGATPLNASLTVSCKGITKNGVINNHGLYRVSDLPLKSNCTLIVNYNNMNSIPITVYTNGIRTTANLELKTYRNQLLIIRK